MCINLFGRTNTHTSRLDGGRREQKLFNEMEEATRKR